MPRSIDVPPGTAFGRWTVIGEASPLSSRSEQAVRCLCQCGTEKVLRLSALRSGRTTSCGCARREAITLVIPPGTVFGRLTVISEAPRMGKCSVRALLCRCECGTEKAIRQGALRSGSTKSCGCVQQGIGALRPDMLNPGEVPLYGKRAAGRVALVDLGDWDLVMQYRWHVIGGRAGCFYAATTMPGGAGGKQFTLRMHVLITGQAHMDHANGNGLDNRRSNLRPATASQNSANRGPGPRHSSQFKGVDWYPRNKKWRARIGHNGKPRHLGFFEEEIAAAKAYDKAARELFGEYARPNFPYREAA